MNIRLNLATRPYIELRPLLARLRIIAVILAVAAVPLWLMLRSEEAKAAQAEAQADRFSTGIATLRAQETSAWARAAMGPDAQILQQADFLNTLFQRKSFSWTATMSDLEENLPSGVQVQDILPVVAPNGHVTIQMRVIGPRDRTIDLVRNLEHSRHFAGAHLVGESVAAEAGGAARPVGAVQTGPGNVLFDVQAGYRPLTAAEAARATSASRRVRGAAELTAPGRRSTAGGLNGGTR